MIRGSHIASGALRLIEKTTPRRQDTVSVSPSLCCAARDPLTVAGLVLLFRAGRTPRSPWSDHVALDDGSNSLPADLAFLASGLVMAVGGSLLLRSARCAPTPA